MKDYILLRVAVVISIIAMAIILGLAYCDHIGVILKLTSVGG